VSVESLVISEMLREGSPKKVLQAGISVEHFEMYDEEMKWIIEQYEGRKVINIRRFKAKFPEFEVLPTRERIQDLVEDLRQERAFVSISSALDVVGESIEIDNALEKALQLKEILGDVIREHSPVSDVMVKSDWEAHYEEMKRLEAIREAGDTAGIPTGFKHLDHHWGGLQGGNLYVPLGRPGDGKSYFLAKLATSAMLDGRRVGLFSPEMNEFQHRCRISTLLSADPWVKKQFGNDRSFRNRALMDGWGFNRKQYRRFLQFIEQEVKGEIVLFTQKWRRQKMSAAYIEGRVEELGIDLAIIDPLYKLRAPSKRSLRHEELGEIVDQVQSVGEAFNIPIVLTNQAGRALVGKGSVPDKDSSHGSDAPIQEADYVVGVRYYEDEGLMTIKGSKSRFGKTFKFDVRFNPNTGFMEETTDPEGSYYNGYDDEKAEQLLRELERDEEEANNRKARKAKRG
jgi:replicative DNA helicase